jgi:hypothetical protein
MAVISFICRPSVLLPAPGEEPGFREISRSGPIPGMTAKTLIRNEFRHNEQVYDSKTGRQICIETMQNTEFAYFLSAQGK